MNKMHVKRGDTVKVIAGKDKGKEGKIITAIPADNKVIVEGCNMQTKHQKQTRTEAAEIKHQEGPIHVSNVMLVDKSGEATRVGYKMDGDKKVRFAKKSGKVID